MNRKLIVIGTIVVLILGLAGYGGYKWLFPAANTQVSDSEDISDLPPADPSITAELIKSIGKADTVNLTVKGLGARIAELAYEFEYDSDGLIKGVNSGSKPLDVSGQDTFEREIYLGTCSKNVCSPDKNVKNISVVIEFIDKDGKKTQLSKEFPL